MRRILSPTLPKHYGNLFHAQAVDAARRSGSRDLIKTATLNMVKALATEGMQAETASATR
jgi:hypothetical protein